MTTQELQELIGQKGAMKTDAFSSVRQPALWFEVEILDARANYGRVDVLVTPVAGSGSVWVNAERVKVRG